MRIVIVGNGVAGISCAFEARERDASATITVISGETDYFFSRTALMYSYMDMMPRKSLEPFERGMYAKKRIDLVNDWVVDLKADEKKVVLKKGGEVAYDKLVFAVGATPNMFPWKGAEDIKDGKVHFVSMQDLDECERLTPSTKQAVVVGGGLIGIELVECLHHHGVKVTFLIREPFYWPMALGKEESVFVARHMKDHGIDVALSEEMTQINVDGAGRVSSIDTSEGRNLPCQMLGIAVGVRAAIASFKEFTTAPECDRGIIVNEFQETSLPDVYAVGDCASIHHSDGRKPYGELIWYSAKRQGIAAGKNLFGDKTAYSPPTFFNSSKFFEIEYTTVGDVVRVPDNAMSIYRYLPGKDVSQRIVYVDDRVIGFNMLGSRWDHEILERWVEERRSVEFVRKHLHHAQYDVEFGRLNLNQMRESVLPLGGNS